MITSANFPLSSELWLGRPFVFASGNSLSWGRYVVSCPDAPQLSEEAIKAFHDVNPKKIAYAFERLLPLLEPNTLKDFLAESEALTTYELAKGHLKALLQNGCWPNEYYAARASVSQCFEKALLIIYKTATPVYNLPIADTLKYRQKLHGMHLAKVSSGTTTIEVAFSQYLILEHVEDNDGKRLWPN